MFRHLLAIVAILTPTLVRAQTIDGFRVPSDVTYTAVTPTYAAGSTENQIGDGSNPRGGTMPVIASQPADIPSVATGWIYTGSFEGSPNYEEVTNLATQESKFRTVADFSHVAFDDPIRNFRQPGTSHCHMFFGSTSTNHSSTYASLRTRANASSALSRAASTIAGGPYNATAYWHPCIIKPDAFGDGKNYAVKGSDYVVYYVENPSLRVPHGQRIPRGMRYVFGLNMDDPYDTIIKAQIAAANAQPGTSPTRYAYRYNGFLGWHCRSADRTTVRDITVAEHPSTFYTGQDFYQGFKTPGGADPWGGNCVAGDWLVAEFNGPNCYDGRNLWSPGGYKHFRMSVTDSVGTHAAKGCPDGWFHLTSINITMWFKHQGWADYSTWYLSSDASATARAQQINPAADAMIPGQSMHTDWMGAWDDTTFMKWQNNCIGVSGGTSHTCANSIISATEALQGGAGGNAPDGSRTPQVDSSDAFTTLTRGDMIQVPASLTGPNTIHSH